MNGTVPRTRPPREVSFLAACAVLTALAHVAAGVPSRGSTLPQLVRIPLEPENGSAETGTAVFAASENGTRVTISLRDAPLGATQPANIHAGACGRVEVIKYALSDVRDGRSESTLAIPLAQLTSSGFVVDVQDSVASMHAAKDARDVSCGKIVSPRKHGVNRDRRLRPPRR